MRFNEDSLRASAKRCAKWDKEGRLSHKAPKENYRERYCKLKGNLLYIYRMNDRGTKVDDEPAGLFVLEQFLIKPEPVEGLFVFSITFDGENDKKHYFSAMSQQLSNDWVFALKQASFTHIKSQINNLAAILKHRTLKDPLPNAMAKIVESLPNSSAKSIQKITRSVPTMRSTAQPRTVLPPSSASSLHNTGTSIQPRRPAPPPPVPKQSVSNQQQPIVDLLQANKSQTLTTNTQSSWLGDLETLDISSEPVNVKKPGSENRGKTHSTWFTDLEIQGNNFPSVAQAVNPWDPQPLGASVTEVPLLFDPFAPSSNGSSQISLSSNNTKPASQDLLSFSPNSDQPGMNFKWETFD